jgi:ribose 1,5-bisphosphate isomerase
VLPEPVEEKIAAVAGDHRSGATHLAERALRAFDLLAASGSADPASVRELAKRLEEAQPAMASVRNVARLAAKFLLETPEAWPAFVGSMQRELDDGRRKAGRNFLKLLERPATVLTLSRSTNVFECLGAAHAKGLLQEVFVLESRPLREGVEFARDLHDAGVRVAVITDGAGGAFIAGATLGLTGADTVLLDGSVVNRTGTHGLAALCRAAGKPFYVACETFKIDTTRSSANWRPPPEQDPREVVEELPARNPYFDLTPAALVTGIVTERGVYRPDLIKQAFAR